MIHFYISWKRQKTSRGAIEVNHWREMGQQTKET